MLIMSQNGEKVMIFGISFNGLEYYKETKKARNGKETERHTICISDGCLEEIAEYPTKERCMEILMDFCRAYENEVRTEEFPDETTQTMRPVTYQRNTIYIFPGE